MDNNEKNSQKGLEVLLLLIFALIFGGLAYLAGGVEGLMKWLSR